MSGAPPYGLTPLAPDEPGVEGLGSGVTDGPLEPGEVVLCALLLGVADPPEVGAWPLQLAAGVGVAPWLRPDALALALVRELELALADALAEALALALVVSVGLALGLVALSFGLAPGLAVSLGLAVSPLLGDGLAVLGDAVTLGLVGAPVDAVDRVGLDVLCFGDFDVCDGDGDVHGTADGLMIPGVALPRRPLAEEPWPVPPGPVGLGVLLDEPVNTSVLTRTKWRSGGTVASTTARANTAIPTPSAGRNMASRQSTGHHRAGRACPGPVPRPGVLPRGSAPWPRGALCSPRRPDRRRTRPARTPAPQKPGLAPASRSAAEA
jgi:hypothetical protein